jgi:hypothetical protein
MSDELGEDASASRRAEQLADHVFELEEIQELAYHHHIPLNEARLLKAWWDMHDEREEMKAQHEEMVERIREEMNGGSASSATISIDTGATFEKRSSRRLNLHRIVYSISIFFVFWLVDLHQYEIAIILGCLGAADFFAHLEHELWVMRNEPKK